MIYIVSRSFSFAEANNEQNWILLTYMNVYLPAKVMSLEV